jgi:23S rRNA pseudouridine1911/1915/1917 synthase
VKNQSFPVPTEYAGRTIAACLRLWLPGQSWTQVRLLIEARRVKINGEVWLDDARRLKTGDTVELLARADKLPPVLIDQIPIRYIDEHIVVVEKPSGISTVRHPLERDWLEERRMLVVTLDDLVMRQIGMRLPTKKHDPRPRLRIVQRLDKETSGLVVFARTVDAERGLGMQFRRHTVTRRYLAIVAGIVTPQTIRSTLVLDRGDGRRGSRPGLPSPSGRGAGGEGKDAVTHVTVEESLSGYTLLSCRLETGRTHQIRIHLAELGHPVCGERVYNRRFNGDATPDESGAPRLGLHAAELGFTHPITEEAMHWEMPPPDDLRDFLGRLRVPANRP